MPTRDLRQLRRLKLLTQKEVALAIGVEYQAVQRWEAGTRYPRPAQQRKLAEVLGVTPEELLAALDQSTAEGKAAA